LLAFLIRRILRLESGISIFFGVKLLRLCAPTEKQLWTLRLELTQIERQLQALKKAATQVRKKLRAYEVCV